MFWGKLEFKMGGKNEFSKDFALSRCLQRDGYKFSVMFPQQYISEINKQTLQTSVASNDALWRK